ncbi:MAG TPA: transposase [Patescibacteria group bacterium]|nr:transposase [Patescibacteria group bacterium]
MTTHQYRIASNRLPVYDYTQPGWYFVTINTKNRHPYFGVIVNGEMQLSKIGMVVKNELLKTPKIRSYVLLDEYVIMPNHIHVIIVINARHNHNKTNTVVETPRRGVSTENVLQYVVHHPKPYTENVSLNTTNHWKPHSLGAMVNQFKSICTKYIRTHINAHFAWQSRYYDHIIRNQYELNRIRAYIRNNAQKHHI